MNISIKRFQNTIKDLTEIGKVQKNINEEITLINVKEAVQDVIASIQKTVEENDALININTEQCKEIHFSRINFRSIIYNLLTNAIKYRSAVRQPIIYVFCHRYESYYVIEFRDNGLGIPKGQKDKIFQMFKRMHSHVEGTGVGLYLVKRIVDNVEGKIEVESEEGIGSTFKVYLKEKSKLFS